MKNLRMNYFDNGVIVRDVPIRELANGVVEVDPEVQHKLGHILSAGLVVLRKEGGRLCSVSFDLPGHFEVFEHGRTVAFDFTEFSEKFSLLQKHAEAARAAAVGGPAPEGAEEGAEVLKLPAPQA